MEDTDALFSLVRRSLYHIKVTINNKQLKVMIDSGAQINVMSYKMMQDLGLLHRLDTSQRGYASGVGQAKIFGILLGCQIEIDNIEYRVNFKVMQTDAEQSHMTLLGLDFLESNFCLIDFRHRQLTINDKIVKFMNEAELDDYKRPKDLQVSKLQELLESMALTLTYEQQEHTKTLLRKISANILKHPSDAKYRQINLLSKEVQTHLLSHQACINLMQHLGFYERDDKLVYDKDTITLQNFHDILVC